jgi:hypothetical protein
MHTATEYITFDRMGPNAEVIALCQLTYDTVTNCLAHMYVPVPRRFPEPLVLDSLVPPYQTEGEREKEREKKGKREKKKKRENKDNTESIENFSRMYH